MRKAIITRRVSRVDRVPRAEEPVFTFGLEDGEQVLDASIRDASRLGGGERKTRDWSCVATTIRYEEQD